MGFFEWLTDTTGFVPRAQCGTEWTDGLIWLHVGSDLAIWLAYLSIPLALLYFVRHQRGLPFSWVLVLFAAFIVSCGFTHFVEAMIFTRPVYHLSGVVKLVTAAVSWVTVLALIPTVPRALELVAAANRAALSTEVRRALPPLPPPRPRGYIVAVLTAVFSTLLRRLLDPVLGNSHPYIIAFPAIVFVAWEAGLGPTVLATGLSALAVVYWVLPPEGGFVVTGFDNQVGLALFTFSGFACALLGEAQQHARGRAAAALAESQARRAELEAEVARRQRVEADLRESEERFRSMADSVSAMIWVSDPHRHRTYFNRTWLEFTGRPLDRQLGSGWVEGIHPDDRPRYLVTYEGAFEGREAFELEYRLRRYDGEYRWVLARGTPRFDALGSFAGFTGLCIDITDRKRATEAVRESEERFRTLAETIPQFVWTCRADGACDYLSRQWAEFTGVPARDHLGGRWLDAVHPDDRAALVVEWAKSVAGGSDFDSEFRIRRHDGAYRWFKTLGVPVRGGDGAVLKWVGTNTDIDDQKREAETLERLVRERTAELRRSNGELEQFAYVASHDLQEPLRKIQAFGDRLRVRSREQLGDQGRDYVDRMLASAGRMSKLIDDLLAYSRVTTHARPFVSTDLGKVVADVLDDLEVRVERAGGRVEVGALPAIDADPTQMRQLFQNLLGNALKFARPDTPPLVEVRGELLDGNGDGAPSVCRVEVADNGIGFDEKYLDRIFQVFQRLHGRGEYEGTGVGLAVCKKIADRHGGTITAHSAPGQGATFVVLLPARHQAPPGADVTTETR